MSSVRMMMTRALLLAMTIVCLQAAGVPLQSASASLQDPLHVWVTKDERSCNFPPSLWCSSRRIAQNCKVESQCERNVWSRGQLDSAGHQGSMGHQGSRGQQGSQDDRVRFALYYETLCPDCKQFVQNQLWPTFQKISAIMDVDLIPYGNARERQVGDHWEFTCQHGANECYGNLVQTCALSIEKNFNVSFAFIACMEMSDKEPQDSAPVCAKAHGVDLKAVLQCVNGPLGNKLEHKMATQTDALDPQHTSVPWVTLNGVHTDDIEQRAESDLLGLICDTYQGPKKPDACNKRHAIQTRGCLRN